ncbi:U6 snRNA phosphodiesterase [Punica granatum]|uniref:U6 snRNA phosphodiesterase n=1 Tax=Punica granatum TaxID=22663 RepID=A0A218X413_PUNGR|nr:U6 snRNA phosphodiesterase [Punica granatum]OWM79420.1 hypothetical protein CDL15_Pgr022832 [Punica granatum]
MEALRASYGCSSDSDTDDSPSPESPPAKEAEKVDPLPPPPLSLISPPNSLAGMFDQSTTTGQPSRVRSFPHVEGNYALHVYIPANIIAPQRPQIALLLKRVASLVPDLFVVDADVPLGALCKDEWKLQQVALGQEFHISLGRTVPIRVHQIDSVVTMLRQKLQSHKRFWIDFSKWEVFVNDDSTRTFLSLEVTKRGLSEIMKQIKLVNEVYRLHDLPEFYKDPRPHISLVWASGDISESLKKVVVNEEINGSMSVRGLPEKCFLTSKFSGIECKIGKKSYKICKLPDK